MKAWRAIAITLAFASVTLLLVPQVTATEYALWVLINEHNKIKKLAPSELRSMYRGERRFWSDNTPVVPMNAPLHSRSRTLFDRVVLHMSPDEAEKYWIDQKVRGHSRPPRKVPSLRLASAMLRKIRGGIAYTAALDCIPLGTRIISIISTPDKISAPEKDIPTCTP